MSDPQVRLVQLLCGPKRHAIMAMAYQDGITRTGEQTGNVLLTPETATDVLRGMIAGLLRRRAMNPWCGVCGAVADKTWVYEDGLTKFVTIEEATPALRQTELEMIQTRKFFEEQVTNRQN